LRQARKLHELFADDKKRKLNGDSAKKRSEPLTLREYYEPKIFDPDSPIGLGAVIAGIAGIWTADKKGKPHKGGKPDDTSRQLELFNKVFDDEFNRWEYWTKFDPETQAAHFKAYPRRKPPRSRTPEELEARAEYHESVAKEFRKAAKEATAAKGDK
jgi:gas vesicle protein